MLLLLTLVPQCVFGENVFPVALSHGLVLIIDVYLNVKVKINGLLWFKIRTQTSMISVQCDEPCLFFNYWKSAIGKQPSKLKCLFFNFYFLPWLERLLEGNF